MKTRIAKYKEDENMMERMTYSFWEFIVETDDDKKLFREVHYAFIENVDTSRSNKRFMKVAGNKIIMCMPNELVTEVRKYFGERISEIHYDNYDKEQLPFALRCIMYDNEMQPKEDMRPTLDSSFDMGFFGLSQ